MLGTIVEDRYLVEAELGAGAMGHVYRARHIKVGRQVAIKVMHAELARVPTIVERFAREARIAARLDHPNVVSVLDVGVTPDARRLPLIVLELAPGTSLVDLTLDAMPREHVVNLIRQLLRGLDHAHDAGLVHRDLKPDNILVEQLADGSYVPRIVDFGIAVCNRDDDPIANRRLTEANTVIGTPLYMSPEQALAKPLDARTDLFSLGVIMYELLAGMLPFPGSGLDVAYMNATKDAPAIVERAGIHVDPLLEAFLQKLMARRLADRFQSAHEALVMLDLIETDRIAAARALTGPTPSVTPVSVPAEGSGPVPRTSGITLPPTSSVVAVDELVGSRVAVSRRSTKITRVEHIAGMRPTRRRALWASALAVAALTAIVGWSAGVRLDAPRAAVQASLTTPPAGQVPSLVPPRIRVEDAPVAIITATALGAEDEAQVAVEQLATPQVAATAKPARAAGARTPRADALPGVKPALKTADVAAAAAVKAAPASSAPSGAAASTSPSAAVASTAPSAAVADGQTLAARYVAVGRALRGAPDDLWARYRLIRINEALASEASRKQALVSLVEIERALRR